MASFTRGDIKMSRKIRVTQKKSGIGRLQRHKDTLKALGLKKIHQTVVHNDTPQIRGMVNSVNHLVEFDYIDE